MNIKKFAKQATVLTFTTALLAGGATQAFAKETNQKPYKGNIRHFPYYTP